MTGRVLALVAGLALVLAGGLFTFQGLGYVRGSSMTGSTTWAVLGPVIAGLGVALVIVAAPRGRR